MSVQAAEIHLRRQLGVTREDAVVLTGRATEGELTTATFAVGGGSHDVVVRTVRDPGSATRLTCKAQRDSPVPAHELIGVIRRA